MARPHDEAKGRIPPQFPAEARIDAGEPSLPCDTESVSAESLRESYRRLVLLYDLGRQICAQTQEQRVFDAILAAVGRLMPVERAFIATFDSDHLVPRACLGIDLSGDAESWPVSTTMLLGVLKEGAAILTTDAHRDAAFGAARSVDLHNIRSVICCPLGTKSRTLGLLYADNRLLQAAFTRADLQFLTALGHYALLAIENARVRGRMSAEKELAEARYEAASRDQAGPPLISASPAMLSVVETARKVARKEVPVILTGETGTGKEVVARLIHASSGRAQGPFTPVHVGAMPATLVESELFGHEKGAFTGADRRRLGRFELARGGTILLDEIQDIPAEVQAKLLRVLEDKQFTRLGGNETLTADVRIVCACNRPPLECVREGRLREDLYYRLSAVVIEIPPLRRRPQDVPVLVEHFLAQCGSRKRFAPEALARMTAYSWPGNVRELKHCVEALDTLVDGPEIAEGDLPGRMREPAAGATGGVFEPLADLLDRVQRKAMARALELAGGNNERAIRLLGVSRAKYFKCKKEYGL